MVAPFFTEGAEGFSIDYPDDWQAAERLVGEPAPPRCPGRVSSVDGRDVEPALRPVRAELDRIRALDGDPAERARPRSPTPAG